MLHNVTFLAKDECFVDQTLAAIPRQGEYVEINEKMFIVASVLWAWTDELPKDPTKPCVFVQLMKTSVKWG